MYPLATLTARGLADANVIFSAPPGAPAPRDVSQTATMPERPHPRQTQIPAPTAAPAARGGSECGPASHRAAPPPAVPSPPIPAPSRPVAPTPRPAVPSPATAQPPRSRRPPAAGPATGSRHGQPPGPRPDHRQTPTYHASMCGYSPYLSRFGRTNRVRSRRPTTIDVRTVRTASRRSGLPSLPGRRLRGRRVGTSSGGRTTLHPRCAVLADSSPQTHGLAGRVRFGMNWPRWMGGDKSARA